MPLLETGRTAWLPYKADEVISKRCLFISIKDGNPEDALFSFPPVKTPNTKITYGPMPDGLILPAVAFEQPDADYSGHFFLFFSVMDSGFPIVLPLDAVLTMKELDSGTTSRFSAITSNISELISFFTGQVVLFSLDESTLRATWSWPMLSYLLAYLILVLPFEFSTR